MDRNFYRITEFARKASVSVRTLRYYDKLGLLAPKHNQLGHRLYTDEDLIQLQYILYFISKVSWISSKRN